MRKLLVSIIVVCVCLIFVNYLFAQDKPGDKPADKPEVKQPELSPIDAENKRYNEASNQIRLDEKAVRDKFIEEIRPKIDEAIKSAAPNAKPEDIKVEVADIAAKYKDPFKVVATKEVEEYIVHMKKISELENSPEVKAKLIEQYAKDLISTLAKAAKSSGDSKSGCQNYFKPKEEKAPAEPFDKNVKYEEMINQDKIKEYAKLVIEEYSKNKIKDAEMTNDKKEKMIEQKSEQKVESLINNTRYIIKSKFIRKNEPQKPGSKPEPKPAEPEKRP